MRRTEGWNLWSIRLHRRSCDAYLRRKLYTMCPVRSVYYVSGMDPKKWGAFLDTYELKINCGNSTTRLTDTEAIAGDGVLKKEARSAHFVRSARIGLRATWRGCSISRM